MNLPSLAICKRILALHLLLDSVDGRADRRAELLKLLRSTVWLGLTCHVFSSSSMSIPQPRCRVLIPRIGSGAAGGCASCMLP